MYAFVQNARQLGLAFDTFIDVDAHDRIAFFINEAHSSHFTSQRLAFALPSSSLPSTNFQWLFLIPGQKPGRPGVRALLKTSTGSISTFTRNDLDKAVERYPACPLYPENSQSDEDGAEDGSSGIGSFKVGWVKHEWLMDAPFWSVVSNTFELGGKIGQDFLKSMALVRDDSGRRQAYR